MKKVFNVIKSLQQKIKLPLGFSSEKNLRCLSTSTTTKLLELNNSCGLTALSRVFPKFSYDDVTDAFYNCCEEWPSSGVKHNEFNVILRYLNIFNNFTYVDNSNYNLNFSDYVKRKGIYILLVQGYYTGHYTVLCNGKIYDSYGYDNLSKNTKVYCSWLLSSGK